ncbi:RcnB family protein [Stenotrophomonas sp. 24(2023)]|uniref:RcnB family protein n=1 Tax=Stenotrophomonas sp. 24(2023) TaxID=3068324 RepID=UPI0027E07DB9|nr:RcnB family protein [Stenotrophomonas sp. 24(2023)]WMJ67799.1 RcnB family protein [Stenotrophomonas sp. 24(2023)]
MRINRVVASAVASVLALGAVSPAFADDDHRQWRQDQREWRQDRRDWQRDRREAYRDYRDDRRDWRREQRWDNRYYRPAPPAVVYRPAPPPPRYGGYGGYGWRVGYPYRNYYSGPVYVVNDYNYYHLSRPPYGHRWIRDDRGNLLLVAIASGIIADFVINGR